MAAEGVAGIAGSQARRVAVVGAGLAGCEAAWQAARRGMEVTLYEMKPVRFSPAHQSEGFAELVSSNSLRSNVHVNRRRCAGWGHS
jgi:folate-dependent tRNA-U54 methylase TrmFO/GidA